MSTNFDAVISAHRAWVSRFLEAIAAETDHPDLANCAYDDLCDFGKWLYALDDTVKMTAPYRRVKDLHYQFHLSASLIVEQIRGRQFDQARRATDGELSDLSGALIQALGDWAQAGSPA